MFRESCILYCAWKTMIFTLTFRLINLTDKTYVRGIQDSSDLLIVAEQPVEGGEETPSFSNHSWAFQLLLQ